MLLTIKKNRVPLSRKINYLTSSRHIYIIKLNIKLMNDTCEIYDCLKEFYENIYGCRFFQIQYSLSPLQDYSPNVKKKKKDMDRVIDCSLKAASSSSNSIDVSLSRLWVLR